MRVDRKGARGKEGKGYTYLPAYPPAYLHSGTVVKTNLTACTTQFLASIVFFP